MIAGIILVTGLLFLASQYIDHLGAGGWHAITIATLFNIPADRTFTGWWPVDQALGFLVNSAEIWIILLCLAALTYWVTDFTAEKFDLLLRHRRDSNQTPPLHTNQTPPVPQPTA